MYKNVFYFRKISSIGGIETFFYQLAKKYGSYDITILYNTANAEQLTRLKKYVRCIRYTGQTIECEKLFCNYNKDAIETIKAKEYYQIVHGIYKDLKIPASVDEKITKYIGVSKEACKSFEEYTGNKTELCYNPIQVEEVSKPLMLISATRLSSEKGKTRMIRLAEELDKKGIKYLWFIFTTDTGGLPSPNVIYMKPTIDITPYIKMADYLIQLSDSEAYCYSVVEGLINGTPVVCTDLKVFNEIGANEDNSIKLDLNCKNIEEVVNKMATKKFNFKYNAPEDNWGNILSGKAGDSIYQEERKKNLKARVLISFTDKEAGTTRREGEIFELTKERFEEINAVGQEKIKKDLIEEIIEPKKEEIEVVVEDTEFLPKKEETKKAIEKVAKNKVNKKK